jgi:hypothetical protein
MNQESSKRLVDVAKVIRSKNAGPLHTTLDLMFADAQAYETARKSKSLSASAIAQRYGVAKNTVTVIPYETALAIKIVIDRPQPAGQPGDRDVYGAQQHFPLLDIEL